VKTNQPKNSVGDPWHFGVDPDPRIRAGTYDYWIRSGSDFFLHWILRMQKKRFCFIFFFIIFQQTHHLQSKKLNFLSNFVLTFYFVGIISVCSTHLWEKGRILNWIRIRTSDYWMRILRIREAQKHADPADPVPDPDPQHCQKISWLTSL
jgi:hypothetical protein